MYSYLLCTLDILSFFFFLTANKVVWCATISLCTTAEVEIQFSIPSNFNIAHHKYVCQRRTQLISQIKVSVHVVGSLVHVNKAAQSCLWLQMELVQACLMWCHLRQHRLRLKTVRLEKVWWSGIKKTLWVKTTVASSLSLLKASGYFSHY